jgi:hypothetical protein
MLMRLRRATNSGSNLSPMQEENLSLFISKLCKIPVSSLSFLASSTQCLPFPEIRR